MASRISLSESLRWGILGAGAIAGEFSDGIAASSTGVVHAVASRSVAKAGQFAAAHQVSSWYGCYEDLLADPGVDIVYVATPHPMHAEWAINAAKASTCCARSRSPSVSAKRRLSWLWRGSLASS